ncbi:MAG: NAD-dependent epimerase/dehydratase family protein [Methylococcales bacterium]|nr:NAD-dependent epimerase/dehydratase family protein [Methylococcales bacterium]
MKRLLITGATGFIGKALIPELLKQEVELIASIRKTYSMFPEQVETINTGDLLASTEWSSALKNVDVVIHMAARVHVMNDDSRNPLAEFRQTNTAATLNLAEQAAAFGVNRFIFISSIKANGYSENKLTPDDTSIPENPYGLSKYEAERGLLKIAKKNNMDVVIIRPPLVYGPYVKGNFLSLLKCVQKNIPLPFGSIHNLRSFVALDNLVDFICFSVTSPKVANEIFIVSDGKDISTKDLLNKIAKAFNKTAFLIPIPTSILSFIGKLVGKEAVVTRVLESLQVDSSKTTELLDWKPIISMDNQLKKIADSYLE